MSERDPNRPRVFVCWSGARSQDLAQGACIFIEAVLPALKGAVFVSTQIEKGARWFDEIVRNLESAQAGLLCLTAENLSSPWLHFEAGALAKGLHQAGGGAAEGGAKPVQSRIFTYLHGATAASLSGPLAQYQSAATTREDSLQLVRALARVLDISMEPDAEFVARFDAAWAGLEKELRRSSVRVEDLLRDFERWFKRKTFEEPLAQCTDQSWTARYDGARQTHERLSPHIATVRNVCPRYQADLYERLLETVDGYAMDVRALLLRAPPFRLGKSGELLIRPKGVLKACERRRGRVRELVSRIVDPLAVPRTEEAAAFWLSDSFAQRKMLVHRRQHALLEQRSRMHVSAESAAELPSPEVAATFRDSVWELDRIYGYLLFEILYPEAPGAVTGLREAAEMEIEGFRARREGASLMPCHYALGALRAALGVQRDKIRPNEPTRIESSVLAQIEDLIERSRPKEGGEPTLDAGGQVRRTIREIRETLPPRREPAHGPASG